MWKLKIKGALNGGIKAEVVAILKLAIPAVSWLWNFRYVIGIHIMVVTFAVINFSWFASLLYFVLLFADLTEGNTFITCMLFRLFNKGHCVY